MNMTFPVAKKTNTKSRNQRLKDMGFEAKHCLDLLAQRFRSLQTGGALKQPRLFIGLTTDQSQRAMIQSALHSYGLGWIIIAYGRISKYDEVPADKRPIFEILTEESNSILVKDLLENFAILLDVWFITQVETGMHAKRCRHVKVDTILARTAINNASKEQGESNV